MIPIDNAPVVGASGATQAPVLLAPRLPDPFPLRRYHLSAVVERPVRLPAFAGSMLRGAFGHALKHIACVTGAPQCKPCPLYRTCHYTAWFETPPPLTARRVYSEIPHPFVIEPPPPGARVLDAGETLEFGIVTMGPALAHTRLAVLAWRRALETGLGATSGRARLAHVWVEGEAEPVFDGASDRWREHGGALALPAAETAPAAVALRFDTPVRIKRAGKVLSAHELAPGDVLNALTRRAADVSDLLLGQIPGWDFAALKRAGTAVRGGTDFEWFDWQRYSNRQERAMPLGGVIGRLVLEGDLRAFWPLLHLGQWLHVGGKTTFGMGRYRLEKP